MSRAVDQVDQALTNQRVFTLELTPHETSKRLPCLERYPIGFASVECLGRGGGVHAGAVGTAEAKKRGHLVTEWYVPSSQRSKIKADWLADFDWLMGMRVWGDIGKTRQNGARGVHGVRAGLYWRLDEGQ